jgi:hypothetical protein
MGASISFQFSMEMNQELSENAGGVRVFAEQSVINTRKNLEVGKC